MKRDIFILMLLLTITVSIGAATTRIDIARFSLGEMQGWEPKVFKGETDYTFLAEPDKKVLQAKSHNSASGLFREVAIDLNKTPYLNWSWKTAQVFDGINEQTKEGDDYPARVYVVFSGGLFFWNTKAINYVWSSNQPVGTTWPNAYTANARMIAVESGSGHVGKWILEKRNVRNDFRDLFNEDPGLIDAVAIMTDTDNSGLRATAWYGDIWTSSD